MKNIVIISREANTFSDAIADRLLKYLDSKNTFVVHTTDTSLSVDLTRQSQRELVDAENIFLVFPIIWGSMGWCMKKFIDDVLEYNIAYFYNGNIKMSEFKNKKIHYITCCRGTPEQMEEAMNSYHFVLKQCVNEFFELDEQLWLPIYDIKDDRELNTHKLDSAEKIFSTLGFDQK